jgi:glycosyltransferase involved in cell wall biosynthesis
MSRILYLAHDIVAPAGGIRVLYRHAEILRRAGFDAYVVHRRPGIRVEWFSSSASVIYATGRFAVAPDDWVVIPEDHGDVLHAFAEFSGNKVLFCQNHWLIFNGIAPEQSWTQFGIREVLVSSGPIRDFVRRVMRVEPTLIPLSIDHSLFFDVSGTRPPTIAVMPRKGSHHMALIRGTVLHLAPELRDVPWLEIQDVSEEEVARILRRSSFFLSTGYREGFGLPPLEAMACGSLVVGFAAGGGADYATADNGFWVADEDAVGLAESLTELLLAYRRNPDDALWHNVRVAGQSTAARYSPQREADALIGFWSKRVARTMRPMQPDADEQRPHIPSPR